jgi:hypothetical protein
MAALKIPVGMHVNTVRGYNKSTWNGILNIATPLDVIDTLAI